MQRQQRIVFLGIAAVIAVVAAIVLGGSGSDEEQQAAAPTTTPVTTSVPQKASPRPAPTTGSTATTAPAPAPPPVEPPVPLIEVAAGKVKGGLEKLEVDKGDRIRFEVRSDKADHVHVHGYDVFKDLPAGKRVTFSIGAKITGIFEIELEDTGVEIAQIRVNP